MNLIQLYFKRDYMSRDAEMCAQHSEYGHSVCVSETSKLSVNAKNYRFSDAAKKRTVF